MNTPIIGKRPKGIPRWQWREGFRSSEKGLDQLSKKKLGKVKNMKRFIESFLPLLGCFLLLLLFISSGIIIYIGLVKHNYDFIETLTWILGIGFFLVLILGSLPSDLISWDSWPDAIRTILIIIATLLLVAVFIHFLTSWIGYYPWWLR